MARVRQIAISLDKQRRPIYKACPHARVKDTKGKGYKTKTVHYVKYWTV